MKIGRKPLLLLIVIASLCFSLAGSAYAFSDVKNDPEKTAIEQLEKQGILKGNGQGKFSPNAQMSVAAAVSLIVRGMDLNIDNMRFIKEPKASDYFTKVPDNAWYAQAFIIATLNGLEIPKDIDPNAKVTREQYAHWLYQAIESKGDYAWTQMYLMMKDENQVNPAYMESIQRLLNGKIAALDARQNFRPKLPITRSEAAGMLHRAKEFVKNTKPIEPVDPTVSILTDAKLTFEKVNDDLLKVTVTANAPHSGYGIEIAGINFSAEEAIVNYRAIMPDPAAFYTQVITEVKATTYVSSQYKPVLGVALPAERQKQETDKGTVLVPYQSQSTPDSNGPSTKHPIKNPDGTSGGTGSDDGQPSGW